MSKTAKEKLENILYGIAVNDDRPVDQVKKEMEADGIDVDGATERAFENLQVSIDKAMETKQESGGRK